MMAELPHFARIHYQPGKRAAWVMAVSVHLLLAVILIYGISWQDSAPEAISVDLVREESPVRVSKPTPPTKSVPKPPPETPVIEPPASPKADILRKDPEKPRPVQEKPIQKVDPIKEMLKREEERIKESSIAEALNRAQTRLEASQTASARNKGLADYLSKVRAKIRGNIVLPPAISGNPESVFVVTQLPSGEVLSVKLKTPSGNPALDVAVERAILKSSPLPKPDDTSLFERELSIKYRPLDD